MRYGPAVVIAIGLVIAALGVFWQYECTRSNVECTFHFYLGPSECR